MRRWIFSLSLILLTLAACVPGGQVGSEPEVVEETAVSPTATVEINPDAQFYAEEFGLSLEEASRRLQLQESVGLLPAELQANESDTFAGLWLEHEPEFKVVVAFTENGAETIRPYIEGQLYAEYVELRTHDYTLAELEAAQQETFVRIEQLEPLNVAGGVNVKENRVYISVGNPDLFLQELADAGLILPEPVVVEAIDPGNLPDSNRGGVSEHTGPDGRIIYFPHQGPSAASMEALMEGLLVLDENGCLRVEDGSEQAPLVLWGYGQSLQIEGDTITVLNEAGEAVARVGEPVRMGGGHSSRAALPGLPLAACPGPYWILGDIEPLAAQAIPDIFAQPVFGAVDAFRAIYIYQSKAAPADGEIAGELTIDADGCLRVDGYAILWPPDIWPDEDTDPLQIMYRQDDAEALIATVGEPITLPGIERTPDDYRFFENKVNCSGPYWGTAELLPPTSDS